MTNAITGLCAVTCHFSYKSGAIDNGQCGSSHVSGIHHHCEQRECVRYGLREQLLHRYFRGRIHRQVGVSSFAPEINGALAIPNCDVPEQFLIIPANGSASGTMPFTSPSNVTAKNKGGDQRRPAGPLAAGAMILAGFAAARRRLRWNRTLSILALCIGLLAGLTATGCGGQGGLVMATGTYGYSIQAVGPGLKMASAYITVTVR